MPRLIIRWRMKQYAIVNADIHTHDTAISKEWNYASGMERVSFLDPDR
jgi:hypothetical protein